MKTAKSSSHEIPIPTSPSVCIYSVSTIKSERKCLPLCQKDKKNREIFNKKTRGSHDDDDDDDDDDDTHNR